METFYKRGDIVYVDYADNVGSEQGGVRPSVVVSNNKGNEKGPTLVVIPMTTKSKHPLPTHLLLRDAPGLPLDSIVLCEQIRVISKARVVRQTGSLPESSMRSLERRIKIALSL